MAQIKRETTHLSPQHSSILWKIPEALSLKRNEEKATEFSVEA
jgi:hypothetical protein